MLKTYKLILIYAVYGAGVYFARDASYSHEYTNLGGVGKPKAAGNTNHGHMFICKVLVGFSAVGNSSIETKNLPKQQDGVTPVDTTTDSKKSIFVIYHDAQAYPEYLITYQI